MNLMIGLKVVDFVGAAPGSIGIPRDPGRPDLPKSGGTRIGCPYSVMVKKQRSLQGYFSV